MQVQFKTLKEKKLVGKHMTMNLIDNKTAELWKNFMPLRKDIKQVNGIELYSLQVYEATYFKKFNPANPFEKWAAVEVTSFDAIPEGMEPFNLESGLYAVFLHQGSSTDTSTYQYIFGNWLPGSEYELDHRPHFEVLGEKYKNNDPDSEEEIWIPIKKKVIE